MKINEIVATRWHKLFRSYNIPNSISAAAPPQSPLGGGDKSLPRPPGFKGSMGSKETGGKS